MTHTYTDQQIIKFIYKECDLFEKLEMEFAMEDDSTLLESYHEFKKGFDALPRVTFRPRKSSLEAILAYSRGE